MTGLNVSGVKIKEFRINRKMTQLELAVALQVDHGVKISRSHLSEIENGKRRVLDLHLKALSEILERPIQDFIE